MNVIVTCPICGGEGSTPYKDEEHVVVWYCGTYIITQTMVGINIISEGVFSMN